MKVLVLFLDMGVVADMSTTYEKALTFLRKELRGLLSATGDFDRSATIAAGKPKKHGADIGKIMGDFNFTLETIRDAENTQGSLIDS
jgi:hypothetical protein